MSEFDLLVMAKSRRYNKKSAQGIAVASFADKDNPAQSPCKARSMR
jgi:hypothetical protein